MTPTAKIIQSRCPSCTHPLRFPAEWVGRSVRCKHCRQAMQLKEKTGAIATPLFEPLSDDLPDFMPGTATLPSSGISTYKPRKQKNIGVWVLSFILLLATSAIGVLTLKPELLSPNLKSGDGDSPDREVPVAVKNTPVVTSTGNSEMLVGAGLFPRRLLVINVSNYIYANPTHNGEGATRREVDRRDITAFTSRISDKWKIPKAQVYELTDSPGPGVKASSLPLKDVIVKTIDLFIGSCRSQDRMMIVFCGHAVEKDGAVFLAPMEADFDEPATMISLADIYAKLQKCPAQEKVAIFDVCRKNTKLGEERPIFGQMTEPMEKAFHTPPPGVSAWTACSANQYSYELNAEQYAEDISTFVNGSIFLNLFFSADFKGKLVVREAGKTGGIQIPDDPLPLTALEAFVREEAKVASKAMEEAEQTPKFTKATSAATVAYNAAEPSPAAFKLPLPKATASAKDVTAIFAELSLPPIKGAKAKGSKGFDGIVPFDAETLKSYLPDEVLLVEAQDKAKYPIRAAVIEATKEIRNFAAMQNQQLPDELREAINDNLKKRLTNLQRPLADAESLFRDLHKQFGKLKEMKAEEKSKRWQANFDYLYAQIDLRLAYFGEYNKALSMVKTDNLDTASAKNGFILGSIDKMAAAKEIRDFAEEGKATLEQMAKDYPGTPWGMLAKRDKSMSLGLKWFPVKLPGETEEKK